MSPGQNVLVWVECCETIGKLSLQGYRLPGPELGLTPWPARPSALVTGPAPVPLSDPGRSPLPVPLWAHSPASGLHAQTLVSRAPAAASSRSGVLSSLHCPRHPASAQGVTSCPSAAPSSWAPECLNPALPHTFLQPPASCLPKQGRLWPHPPDPASQQAWHCARWGSVCPRPSLLHWAPTLTLRFAQALPPLLTPAQPASSGPPSPKSLPSHPPASF